MIQTPTPYKNCETEVADTLLMYLRSQTEDKLLTHIYSTLNYSLVTLILMVVSLKYCEVPTQGISYR